MTECPLNIVSAIESMGVRIHFRSQNLLLCGCLIIFQCLPALSSTAGRLDTLKGTFIVGYQGWFACPGDDDGHGWVHWSNGTTPTVDMLPDVSELPPGERCRTGMTAVDGSAIDVFSSRNPATVARHFAWMRRFGIDGAALQRFSGMLHQPRQIAVVDQVLANVRQAAEASGRGFFVMYDISGLRAADIPLVLQDWQRLEDAGNTSSRAWISHKGHPVLGIWGLGFAAKPLTPDDAKRLLAGIARISAPHGGITILGGVPPGWRTGTGDASSDPSWQTVWPMLGVISPWTVGRFADDAGADAYLRTHLAIDLEATRRMGIDIMPVVFPGFSWGNLMHANHHDARAKFNEIPRRCGRFYWHQLSNALSAGATMLYGAMFDEVDEGTALFKLVPGASQAPARTPDPGHNFVTLDADGCRLPSDWYLRLTGAASAALHTHKPLPPTLPQP
jgi:hypothetical protein